ncbi:HAD family hydrolase [Acidisoma sp.]|uniref:HAD family hydrolase n=1 Tax=Acidisoma sp. TaxID=1872115 RepID=UPI003AFF7B0C
MTDATASLADPVERRMAQGGADRTPVETAAYASGTGATGMRGAGPVFVDFDYTLFGSNSTELFIASCRPSLLVAIIEFAVRRCIPWRLTGFSGYFRLRDFVCCMAIIVLCPWSIFMWRRRAPKLFERHVSKQIAARLSEAAADRIVIVSFGLNAIIRPLLKGSPWQDVRLIATPSLPPPQYFGRGKLPVVRKYFGAADIAASTFLTDSLDDRDLLEASGDGILIEPQGETCRAIEHLYIPLRYTARAKYAASYVFDQVLFVECLLAVFATVTSFDGLLSKLACMPFFTLSLMCIYEIGYFENDMVAAAREDAPTLTKHSGRFRSYPMQPAAWIWAVAAAAAGAWLACFTGVMHAAQLPRAALLWLGSLILLRIVFFAYNRVRPAARIAVYPVLQMLKYLPLFLLFPATPAGAVLAFCQATTMSLIYLVYRQTGQRRVIEKEQFRTAMFAVALCFMATASTTAALGGRFALGLLAVWCLVRLAKAPILRLVRGIRRKAPAEVPA